MIRHLISPSRPHKPKRPPSRTAPKPQPPRASQRAQDPSRGAPLTTQNHHLPQHHTHTQRQRDRAGASIGGEQQTPSRNSAKAHPPPSLPASAGPIPRSTPPVHPAEAPSRPRLGTVWGMRRSFRTLRLCSIPGVSPRAGMRCPVGALRTPYFPRAPTAPTPAPQQTCSTTIIFPHRQQSTTPIEGQAPNQRSGSGTGPERALEAITQSPRATARKLILPRAYLRVQDRSRGAPSRH